MKPEDFKHGMRVKCQIEGFEIKDAKISIENNEIFICQNHFDGVECKNKMSYLWSWCIGNASSLNAIAKEEVTNLEPASDLDLVPTKGVKLLVWDDDEEDAVEREIYANTPDKTYPWLAELGELWEHAKPIPPKNEVKITVKINGKKSKLNDISEEDLLKLRNL